MDKNETENENGEAQGSSGLGIATLVAVFAIVAITLAFILAIAS